MRVSLIRERSENSFGREPALSQAWKWKRPGLFKGRLRFVGVDLGLRLVGAACERVE